MGFDKAEMEEVRSSSKTDELRRCVAERGDCPPSNSHVFDGMSDTSKWAFDGELGAVAAEYNNA